MIEGKYVDEIKNGKAESFSCLVDLYYDKIFYHCIKLMKNDYDAADVTQNTFLKAFIKIDNLKRSDSFGAWIFSICNNEIKSFYRNNKKEPLPNTLSEFKEYNELYSAIDSLDEKHRSLILLKYFSSFSVKEMSMLTELKENLIKSRLYEARKQIKSMLSDNSFVNKTPHNKSRRIAIMKVIKLLDLGSRVVPCMSLWGQNELLNCARKNQKFSEPVLSELSRIKDGEEFVLECKGRISYDEFIKILVCCDEDVLYRLNGQDYKTWRNGRKTELFNDVISYINVGGYIDGIEMILNVPSIIETVNWYMKYLGWNGDNTQEDEDYGYSQVRVYNNDVTSLMSNTFKGFHLRKAYSKEEITRGTCFVMVTSLETMHDKIKSTGWKKITDIYVSGWGTKQFRVEDLNGFILEFSEWISSNKE